MDRALTIGTAGHIDHGKTALVEALTGTNTDRLEEERRRGISIELGFAELDLGGRRASVVDVPGHERFVRTMVAGAAGIDLYLLVVAADDGVMPQTVEHVAVLRALGVESGVVALTKCDAAEAPARARAAAAAAELLDGGAPIVEVSARAGTGLAELRDRLREVAGALPAGAGEEGVPLLHVDRAFTVVGHGTVVTGTLLGGPVRRGQLLRLLPEGREARVRSLQVHDRPLESAAPHQRVALNLSGLGLDEVERGDVLAGEGAGAAPTYRLDVELRHGAERIPRCRRVRAHLGTRESAARVVDLGEGCVQLRLERPLIARQGDRVVVRSLSPPDTLGGGVVLRAAPPRHGPGWRPGLGDGAARSAPRPAAPSPRLPGPLARELLAALRDDGLRPRGAQALADERDRPRREVERALAELVAAGEVVRVRRDVLYPASVYAHLRRETLAWADWRGSVTIAELRDLLGLSRKYAQALLEHLDDERLLRRDGDRHCPRRRPAADFELMGRQGSGGPSGLQSQQGGAAHRLEGSIPSPPRPSPALRRSARGPRTR